MQTQVLQINFNQNPFIAIWEMTRSCALKCLHCRAEAIEERDRLELTTDQAFMLLKEIRLFGKPLVVLTGGDPMRRPDVFDIVEYGAQLGLRMALTPSGTAEMTCEKVQRLNEKGLARLAVSLDGSNAQIHDSFRKVEGSFHWTLQILRWADEVGLSTQINTTMTRHNLKDVEAICELLRSLHIALWSVFFLVPVGRGKLDDAIGAEDFERVFHKMAELSEHSSFDIKSTEAPHYRRVLLQRKHRKSSLDRSEASDGVGRAAMGVNDGKGFVFISHTGDIFPSGFLPLKAGNVKTDSLVTIYRDSPLFRSLRDPNQLKGKCGACEYKSICGGSRARSFALTGDVMAQDPFCTHVPKGYTLGEEEKQHWQTVAN